MAGKMACGDDPCRSFADGWWILVLLAFVFSPILLIVDGNFGANNNNNNDNTNINGRPDNNNDIISWGVLSDQNPAAAASSRTANAEGDNKNFGSIEDNDYQRILYY
jgi:hypothetical protein